MKVLLPQCDGVAGRLQIPGQRVVGQKGVVGLTCGGNLGSRWPRRCLHLFACQEKSSTRLEPKTTTKCGPLLVHHSHPLGDLEYWKLLSKLHGCVPMGLAIGKSHGPLRGVQICDQDLFLA